MMLKRYHFISLIWLCTISMVSWGQVDITVTTIEPYDMHEYDARIEQLYDQIPNKLDDLNRRIDYFSEKFLGAPYVLFPLGEGVNGKFAQGPLYRTDVFDCLTYVETILALAFSNTLDEFKEIILTLRYQDVNISFVNRNHFTTVDWNPNNTHKGYVQDFTYRFIDEEGQPAAKIAATIINKPGWYQHFRPEYITRLDTPNTKETKNLLKQLHNLSADVQQEKGVLLYLPLNKLFDEQGQPNDWLFQQIPSGSIVQIVRPNWDLTEQIGTHLNVSHLGFALRKNGTLIYREASSIENAVIDIPLTDYLKNYLDSPTVKGIHVLIPTNTNSPSIQNL